MKMITKFRSHKPWHGALNQLNVAREFIYFWRLCSLISVHHVNQSTYSNLDCLMCCTLLKNIVIKSCLAGAWLQVSAYDLHVLQGSYTESLAFDVFSWFLLFGVIYWLVELCWRLTVYPTKFDIAIERLTYDFGLAEPVKFKKKRKKINRNSLLYIDHNDFERVLTDEEIRSHALPSWLRSLTHIKLRELISNLRTYTSKGFGDTDEETYRMVDIKTSVSNFKNSYHTVDWKQHTIYLLHSVFDGECSTWLPTAVKVFPHHSHILNPVIYAPGLSDLGDVELGTFWYDFVSEHTLTSYQLTPGKIRAIIKGNIDKLDDENILLLLSRKMSEDLTTKESAWIIPYIPYDYLTVNNTADTSARVFASIKERVLVFARNYLAIARLPSYEQTKVRKLASAKFSIVLGKPKYQKMFIEGVPRDFIMDTVYLDNYEDIYHGSNIENLHVKYKKLKNKEKSQFIHKARDEKYGFYDDIQVENFIIMTFLTWLFNKIMWHIFGIQYYREKKMAANVNFIVGNMQFAAYRFPARIAGAHEMEVFPSNVVDFITWHNNNFLEPRKKYRREINFFYEQYESEKRRFGELRYNRFQFHYYKQKIVEACLLLWHHNTCEREVWDFFTPDRNWSKDDWLHAIAEATKDPTFNYIPAPTTQDADLLDCIYNTWRKEMEYHFECKMSTLTDALMHRPLTLVMQQINVPQWRNGIFEMAGLPCVPNIGKMRVMYSCMLDCYPMQNKDDYVYKDIYTAFISAFWSANAYEVAIVCRNLNINPFGTPVLADVKPFIEVPNGTLQQTCRMYNLSRLLCNWKTEELQWEYYPHEMYTNQLAQKIEVVDDKERWYTDLVLPMTDNMVFNAVDNDDDTSPQQVEEICDVSDVTSIDSDDLIKDQPSIADIDIEMMRLPVPDVVIPNPTFTNPEPPDLLVPPDNFGKSFWLSLMIYLLMPALILYYCDMYLTMVTYIIFGIVCGISGFVYYFDLLTVYRIKDFLIYMHLHYLKFYYGDQNRPVRLVVDSWSKCFFQDASDLTPEAKLVLVNIKAVMHAAYYAIKGDWTAALSHATYCAVTEPKMLIDAISSLRQSATADPYARYDIDAENDSESAGVFNVLGTVLRKFDVVNMSDAEIRRANSQFQFMNNGVRAFSGAMGLTNKIVAALCRTMYAFDPFDLTYRTYVTELIDSRKAMDRLLIQKNRQLFTKLVIDEIRKEYFIALSLVRDARFERELPSFVAKQYVDRFKEFEKLYKQATNYLDANIGRFETVAVLFCGPNSVGKSAALKLIKQMIVRAEWLDAAEKDKGALPAEFDSMQEFIFNEATEYFEGYHQQKIVICDDFGSSSDVSDRRMGALPHIHMVNGEKYNLNMAFEGKGGNNFDSDYLFITTNLFNEGFDNSNLQLGLTDNEAWRRRMNLVVYRTKRLEDEKLDDASWLVERSLARPDLIGKVITTKEVALLTMETRQFKLNQATHHSYDVKAIDDLLKDRVIAPRLARPGEFDHKAEMRRRDQIIKDHRANNVGETRAPPKVDNNNNPPAEDIKVEVEEVEADAAMEGTIFQTFVDEGAGPQPQKRKGFRTYTCEEILTYFAENGMYEWSNHKYRDIIIGIAVVICMVILGKMAYEWFSVSKDEFDVNDESFAHRTQGKAPKRVVKIRYAKDIRPQNTELDKHVTTLKIGDSVATMRLRVYNKANVNIMACASECFHLKDDYYLCCYHSFAQAEDYMNNPDYIINMELDTLNGCLKIPFDHTNMLAIEGKDMCLYYLRDKDHGPAKYSRPPACFKNIVSESDFPTFANGSPLSLVTRDGKSTSYAPVNYFDLRMQSEKDYEHHQAYGYTYCVRKPLRYTSNTRGGYSGAPVTYQNKNGAAIIVGIHYGRSEARSISFATPITKEFIQSMLEQFDEPIKVENEALAIEYTVAPSKAYLYPTNSKIKRGPMWGCFGLPKYTPARLKPFTNCEGEYIEPYKVASSKLFQTPTPFYSLPEDFLLSYLQYCFPDNTGARLLSFEECLAGVPMTDMKSICLGTSAGYPWNLGAGKGKFKYVWIDNDGAYNFDPDFLQYLLECENQLVLGKQIEVIWCDILKDERVSQKKVNIGKTRLFAGCPLHYLFLMRRYTLAFVEYMQSLCVEGPVSIGINAHSLDWQLLCMKFVNAQSVVSGDYVNFDGSIPDWVGRIVVKFINAWYNDGPINARIRELLFEHIWSAWRIHGNNVYRVYRGNPSGNPFTGPYNSLCNLIMLVYCCILLGVDPMEAVFAVYGDDNLIGFKDIAILVKHLVPIIKDVFNMSYTHWSKEEVEDKVDTIWDIRYLGRKFVPSSHYILAPLEIETILESIYWYKKGNTPEEALIQVSESFFTELAHHGKDVYDMYSQDFLKHVKFRAPELHAAVSKVCKPWFSYINRFYHPDGEFTLYPQTKTINDIEPEGLVLFEVSYPVTTKDSNEYNERSTNVPSTTQKVPLGTYADVNESEATNAISAVNKIYDIENFEHMTLNNVLEREYLLADVAWTTSQGVAHEIASLQFPRDLFDVPYIQKKLAEFRFFKGGVDLTIRVTASKFLYGCLMAVLVPLGHAQTITNDMVYMSGFPHILLNADAGTIGSISQDFISPYRELKMRDHVADELATFKLYVLNPLYSIDGEVHSCRVQVYANFKDVKVSMPSTYIVAESKNEMLDKAYANVNDPNLESNDPITAALGKVAKNIPDFIKTSASALEVLSALDMPTAMSQTTIGKLHPWPDMNQGKGVKMLPKASLDPTNQVAPRLDLGMAQDEMKLSNIMGTPMLIHINSLSPSTTTPQLLDTYGPNSECYADWFAQFFAYVAGSLKYKIYVTASKYHNVRVVFWLNFESDTHATNHWQDCYHQIYEIEGSTEIEFTVPYLNHSMFRKSKDPYSYTIRYAVLAWSQADMALSLPIWFNIYKAMHRDVDVAGYLDTCIAPESNPRADFCKDFPFFHSSFTDWKTDNIVMGEHVDSVGTLIKKFHPYNAVGGSATYNPLYKQIAESGGHFIGYEKFGRFFTYHRGSKQFRCTTKNAAYETVVVTLGPADTELLSACDITTPYINPSLELEVPFYYDKLFIYNNSAKHDINVEPHFKMSSTLFVWKAAGDDFTFGLLRPLQPGYKIEATPAAHGYKALFTWYST